MSRTSTTPTNALALADYLSTQPLLWICGLPGGAFTAAVSRIDGDVVEVTSVCGGRRRQIVMPSGWNCRGKRPPVRTLAIRNAFVFHEWGFIVTCVERRNPLEVLQLRVRYVEEGSPFQ
jgi:hypothetical protein